MEYAFALHLSSTESPENAIRYGTRTLIFATTNSRANVNGSADVANDFFANGSPDDIPSSARSARLPAAGNFVAKLLSKSTVCVLTSCSTAIAIIRAFAWTVYTAFATALANGSINAIVSASAAAYRFAIGLGKICTHAFERGAIVYPI